MPWKLLVIQGPAQVTPELESRGAPGGGGGHLWAVRKLEGIPFRLKDADNHARLCPEKRGGKAMRRLWGGCRGSVETFRCQREGRVEGHAFLWPCVGSLPLSPPSVGPGWALEVAWGGPGRDVDSSVAAVVFLQHQPRRGVVRMEVGGAVQDRPGGRGLGGVQGHLGGPVDWARWLGSRELLRP